MIKNLDVNIDYNKLYQEYVNLDIDNLLSSNYNLKQIAVQCRQDAPKESQLTESCGSLHIDWIEYEKNPVGKLPLRKKIYKENQFDKICDLFVNTEFEKLIQQISLQYKVVRGRFMLLQHKTCLTYHKDSSKRIHIPIYTNENCMMIINDIVYRMPFGNTYLVDTTVPHTALNASKDPRVHLVFCLNTD